MVNPNEYIINPNTNRAIKVGSKIFNTLVQNAELADHKQVVRKPTGQKVVKAFSNRKEAEQYRNKLNKGNKDTSHSYSLDRTANRVVKRRTKATVLKAQNIVNNVANKASDLIHEVPNISDMDKKKLKTMILQRLISNKEPKATIRAAPLYEDSDNSIDSEGDDEYETHYVDSDYPSSATDIIARKNRTHR